MAPMGGAYGHPAPAQPQYYPQQVREPPRLPKKTWTPEKWLDDGFVIFCVCFVASRPAVRSFVDVGTVIPLPPSRGYRSKCSSSSLSTLSRSSTLSLSTASRSNTLSSSLNPCNIQRRPSTETKV